MALRRSITQVAAQPGAGQGLPCPVCPAHPTARPGSTPAALARRAPFQPRASVHAPRGSSTATSSVGPGTEATIVEVEAEVVVEAGTLGEAGAEVGGPQEAGEVVVVEAVGNDGAEAALEGPHVLETLGSSLSGQGAEEDSLAADLPSEAGPVDMPAAAVAAAAVTSSPPATAATATTTTATAPSSSAPPASRRKAPTVTLPLQLLRRPPSAPRRTFPPPLDLPALQAAVLGEPTIGPIFADLFALVRARAAEEAGAGVPGPLLYAPQVPRPAGAPPADTLPLLVYLPGIDGTGLAAYRQFEGLAGRFDLRALFMPPEDRTPFAALVEAVAGLIEDEASGLASSRPVYLLGESFGGLLALALAQRLSCVDRLILVNPATSFASSPWPALGPLLPRLPADLYALLPVALSPLLANPLSMASRAVSSADSLPQQLTDLLYGLLDLLPELSSLRVVLPPTTLAWRLELLGEGARAVNPTLSQVKQRVLLLAGQLDLVIPSAQEAGRLEAALPRCAAQVLPGRSHALLQEGGLDLAQLVQDADFYIPTRRLSRPAAPARRRASPSAPAPGGAAFGTTAPIELPTPGELRAAMERAGIDNLKRLVSPVYLSTDGPTGRIQLGLDGLPAPGSGPVLFVGNHQLFAPDMPLMISHFLEERGQMLRGLAHPMALGLGGGGTIPGGDNSRRFGRFLETFGAVPVGGRAMYDLLAAGEAALLYPGGVREALKLKDEQYALIWPRRPEFVRMAAKLGATIVPFAAVGAEDSVEVLLDRKELLSTPVLGSWLKEQQDKTVLARVGVSASEDVEESFISPLVSFKPPARFYFLFGAPIPTDPGVAADREACDDLYSRVRGEVEGCLGYLLRKRQQDPYGELAPRLLYEAAQGGRRQAPTFKP